MALLYVVHVTFWTPLKTILPHYYCHATWIIPQVLKYFNPGQYIYHYYILWSIHVTTRTHLHNTTVIVRNFANACMSFYKTCKMVWGENSPNVYGKCTESTLLIKTFAFIYEKYLNCSIKHKLLCLSADKQQNMTTGSCEKMNLVVCVKH